MTDQQLRIIHETKGWRAGAAELLRANKPTADAVKQFESYWITAGHHIREQIADDRVLVCLLRHVLPAYDGDALELFRGENVSRWEAGAVGLAWTPDVEIGRMFASGLNSIHTGGVLLRARFEPAAIISGPSEHSKYLGEHQFTVDPFNALFVSAVEWFPAV